MTTDRAPGWARRAAASLGRTRWWVVIACAAVGLSLRLILHDVARIDPVAAVMGAACIGAGFGGERWVSSRHTARDVIPFTGRGLHAAAPLLVLGLLLIAVAVVPTWF
ncbi:hypothetical protein [Luteimicrobium subarcticum]|uniref:Uncharacterized protein n=1 Tax=Luteimicrobium subarcticum TaxID=620910 RepID=A0A2M8WV03_9MICO|nr:hypothetical protein [Luteimicrobium subarcticum]PJI94767.1 hypothetical protein CLV34_0614 [Luteimicrobium subarcticum]